MKRFFNTLSVIMLVLLVICAVLYFVKGVFLPVSGMVLILFIIAVAGTQKYRDKKKNNIS